MVNAPHILAQVADLALAAGRADFELFTGKRDQPVRIRNHAANLWIMRADEDGSMHDRWASDEGKRLIKLGETDIEQGPAALWAQLRTLADDIISNREDTK